MGGAASSTISSSGQDHIGASEFGLEFLKQAYRFVGSKWPKKDHELQLLENMKTSQLYQLKKLDKSRLTQSQAVEKVMAERHVLMMSHEFPYVARMLMAFQEDRDLFLLLECPNMTLKRFAREEPQLLAIRPMTIYLAEMIASLQYVHEHGYLLRSLTPDMIEVDASGHISLANLSHCVRKPVNGDEDIPKYLEDAYRPPYGEALSTHGDFWALGICFMEIINQKNYLEILAEKTDCEYPPYRFHKFDPLGNLLFGITGGTWEQNDSFVPTLKRLLQSTPKKRLGHDPKQVWKDPLFQTQDIEYEKLMEKAYTIEFQPKGNHYVENAPSNDKSIRRRVSQTISDQIVQRVSGGPIGYFDGWDYFSPELIKMQSETENLRTLSRLLSTRMLKDRSFENNNN